MTKRDESKKVVIMGDLNSRVGTPTNLNIGNDNCVYVGVEDQTVNKNGQCLLDLCRDNGLVVVNNLRVGERHYKSNLSFRKKANWISEPDVLLASASCVQHIESFNMLQRYENKFLYSDHALLEFKLSLKNMRVSTDLLWTRASNLGRRVRETEPILIEKSVRLGQCNLERVKAYFEQNMPPDINDTDTVDIILERFNRTVTDVLMKNKEERELPASPWGNEERWKRLLQENDHRTIWKSIGWDGSIEEPQLDIPSDGDFKLHFEQLLNPPGIEEVDLFDVSDSPYIPLLDNPIEVAEVIEAADV